MRCIACLLAVILLVPPGALQARQPVHARHAMVVSQEPNATEVGIAVLKSGGNAVDAAVAIGFALAVTHPSAGNIGGGGFMLIRLADGQSTFIDFRERAPGKASRNMYIDAKGNVTRESIDGWRAAGVPGTVRGLEYAHKKWGRKPWKNLVAPSINLARAGFEIPYSLSEALKSPRQTASLSKFPESKLVFLNNGNPLAQGDKLVQPDLANTLDRIAREGANDFYEGETARKLAAEMAANGGLITLDDLKNYKAVERTPITGKYKEYRFITAPPPSSGGIGILEMLGILEGSGYEKGGAGAASTVHYVAEAMRRFYADRSQYFADPDYYHVPMNALLNPNYIRKQRESIDPLHASSSEQVRPGNVAAYESTETTHYNVVDAEGNAVAVTYTLNGTFGSFVAVPGLGFLLNNEMDDFAAKPGQPNMFKLVQGEANAIQPGKRPLSSMTPTIVLRDNKTFMVYGGPGGSRITSSVLQVFLNVADFGMNIQDAIDRPRFHHQWQPDEISMEPGFSPDTIKILQSMGHKVAVSPAASLIEGILIDQGWLQGGSDGRAGGKAQGY
jgi:gamma-glutamyltranspeptidase/glutathione hydrolase